MEIFISFVVVVVICVLLYWLASKLPPPLALIGQIIVIAGGAIWLIANLRGIIRAIAGA